MRPARRRLWCSLGAYLPVKLECPAALDPEVDQDQDAEAGEHCSPRQARVCIGDKALCLDTRWRTAVLAQGLVAATARGRRGRCRIPGRDAARICRPCTRGWWICGAVFVPRGADTVPVVSAVTGLCHGCGDQEH